MFKRLSFFKAKQFVVLQFGIFRLLIMFLYVAFKNKNLQDASCKKIV